MTRLVSLILILSYSLSSCLSFKGISIDPNVSTFYIDNIILAAPSAPAELSRRFQDDLTLKFNDNTRLVFNDSEPDIEFSGSITDWRVTSAAPQAGEDVATSAFNRLSINVSLNYINNLDEDDNWKQSFSHFVDFDNETDLLSVQDDLIDQIFEQITEDIFNKAFTDW